MTCLNHFQVIDNLTLFLANVWKVIGFESTMTSELFRRQRIIRYLEWQQKRSGLFNTEFPSFQLAKSDGLNSDESHCYFKLFHGLSTSLEWIKSFLKDIHVYIMRQIIRAFCFILTYDLLADRRIEDVILTNIFPILFSRGYARRRNGCCYGAKYANVSLTQM